MIKGFDQWLLPHLRQKIHAAPVTDVMLAVCDHFEPFHHTDKAGALGRMKLWREKWPTVVAQFKDHDGIGPRHSFFYPIEQYDRDVINELAALCRDSGGEGEVHLHHHNDTAENLIATLDKGKDQMASHGLLSRDQRSQITYGFIHGNWALDDSDPTGKGCGVRNELAILKQSGCYADFTMPSAPHPTQTNIINSIYYARSTPHGKSHNRGDLVNAGQPHPHRDDPDHLLLIQGPLGLEWRRRKWGVLPRVENGDLTGTNPPSAFRARRWLQLAPSLVNRPEWRFIKLHTHGAIERNREAFLGDASTRFHSQLAELADEIGFRLHYVSAREMTNIILAAEDGQNGDAGQWRNYRYTKG
ncbi:hypothetical protein FEM03_17915 [Phragmitibacter flavus]|uniref:Uncharacterized protein n=1 Tax=Phragmitibacter flavus TaxID=2576071 RepID=A0A5R8KAA7_9BACT|nr:hypothetical protein [Phragmitibacter flavus]TLD69250.1 hypothetical protein FEM03_17915 [Phragmitibacter flavus]